MSSIKNDRILPQIANQPNAKPSNDKRDPKMLEAARGFENIFLRQMVGEMRKSVPDDPIVPESMADKIFNDQLDSERVNTWVNEGGVGLADLIYDQMQERYGTQPRPLGLTKGQLVPLDKNSNLKKMDQNQVSAHHQNQPHDILKKAQADLFLAKKMEDGFLLKSREPLPEKVSLRSPLSGIVLQAASLEDGRQMVVVKHDQGLVSQFVHTGLNRVKTGIRVDAGEPIIDLPASQNGEGSRVFFGLRKASKIE